MESFEWEPRYSVGHPVLDSQHRKLLGMCKAASLCLDDDSPEGTSRIHLLLNDLAVYAQTHFRTEEQILRQIDYALFEEHRAEHEDYFVSLTEILSAAAFGEIDKAGLHRYLLGWWLDHILVSDMCFAERMHTLLHPSRNAA